MQVEYTATEVTCADQQDATITIDEIIGGFPPYDILWSNSENGEMIEELEEGSYTFTITDDKGCTIQETVVVSLSPQPCLFIPNAFSPNGDTVNDVWNIRNIQLYPEVLIRVFNKWGEQVFESMGYTEAWDGTFRGNLLPPATYYYVLDLQNGDPIYKGALSILR